MSDDFGEDFLDSFVHMQAGGPIIEHSAQYLIALDVLKYCLDGFLERLVFGLKHVEVVLALLLVETLELGT